MRSTFSIWAGLALAASLALSSTAPTSTASACCAAPPPGTRVQIADQEVLVVWDPKTKTEHFIRKADFVGDLKDFAFLVPTPGEPTLAEADGMVFTELRRAIKPRVEYVTERVFKMGSLFLALGSAPDKAVARGMVLESAKAQAVEVLQRRSIAGMDAVVLKSTSAEALKDWLDKNGYAMRDTITEWLKPYVKLGWKITAFKYGAKTKQRAGASVPAVRMSFKTDKPIFPYRVPRDQLSKEREPMTDARGRRILKESSTLRVFFIGPKPMQPSLGAASKPWDSKLRYGMPQENLPAVVTRLDGGLMPSAGWLQAWDDKSWPGGTEDLFFDVKEDTKPFQEVVKIPRKQTVLIPFELVALVLLVAGGVFWWRRSAGA